MEVVVMPSPWRWSHSFVTPPPILELVAFHYPFDIKFIIIVDPAAFNVTIAFARVSVVAIGALLPDPLVSAA